MRPFSATPFHPDEAGYRIEDGIIQDFEPRRTARRTRHWTFQPQAALAAEEAAWAARSGPVHIIQPGRKP